MRGPLLLAAMTLMGSAQSGGLTPQLADAFEKKIVLVQKQSEQKASQDRATTFTRTPGGGISPISRARNMLVP